MEEMQVNWEVHASLGRVTVKSPLDLKIEHGAFFGTHSQSITLSQLGSTLLRGEFISYLISA